ncbi:MAG: vWA domain-containing protein [Alphaproteobacteria bacterium]
MAEQNAAEGRLAENISYFCRALRRAGVPVGTAQLIDTVRAVQVVGFEQKADFFFTLRACLISRPEHLQVFGQVFRMFWRDPEFLEKMITNMLPTVRTAEQPQKPKAAEQRAAEALIEDQPTYEPEFEREQIEVEAKFSFSATEKLKSVDFEVMTNAEIRLAEEAVSKMVLPAPKVWSRRLKPSNYGRKVDPKAVFRAARKTGGLVLHLPKRKPQTKPLDLILLCDISGSMTTYSRMMMHFIHAVSLNPRKEWANVHAFTFGTRLSNITKMLSIKDPDTALATIGSHVQDWEGGTQIGSCIGAFNKDWSRRVLSGQALVLLVTDGLERGVLGDLSNQMKRLHLSSKQLVWLNPLLRWDGFSPQAAGIRAMLPHVDKFIACHNLSSISELAKLISTVENDGHKKKMLALL